MQSGSHGPVENDDAFTHKIQKRLPGHRKSLQRQYLAGKI